MVLGKIRRSGGNLCSTVFKRILLTQQTGKRSREVGLEFNLKDVRENIAWRLVSSIVSITVSWMDGWMDGLMKDE